MHGYTFYLIFHHTLYKIAACPGHRLISLYAPLEGRYGVDGSNSVNWFVAGLRQFFPVNKH